MKSRAFVFIQFIFVISFFLYPRLVLATVHCRGSQYYCVKQCTDYATGYCEEADYCETASCSWGTKWNLPNSCVHDKLMTNTCTIGSKITYPGNACTGTGGGSGCGGNVCPSEVGCWTCNDAVCKTGTTTYTQACGSSTRNYSCTNECGGTNRWTTEGNPCKECGPYISAWTPACGSQTRTCTEDCGTNNCAGVATTNCQHCEPTIGPWGACDSNHKRHRTCTENDGLCDGSDCAGVVTDQDCEGSIQGVLFDASNLTVCPDIFFDDSILIKNKTFTMISPYSNPGWPSINGASRTVGTKANGTYGVSAYAPGTYSYDFSALGDEYAVTPKLYCKGATARLPGCDPADLTQPCASARVTNVNFGFWRIYGGWWQVTGGNVYARNGLKSTIPATLPETDQKLILSDSFGRSGLLSYGFAWVGTELGTNAGATVSTPLWRVQSTYSGLRYDFNYFQTRMDVFASTAWDGGAVNYDDKGVGYQIFKHTGDVTLSYGGPTGTQKAVLLVDGNVTINNNITVPNGAFLGVVARGNIAINPNVTAVQGWFVGETINIPCSDVADPLGTCDKNDVQFVGEGSFVGWTTVSLARDMGFGNNNAPPEKFVYRPDLYLNAPDPMKVYTKRFTPFIP